MQNNEKSDVADRHVHTSDKEEKVSAQPEKDLPLTESDGSTEDTPNDKVESSRSKLPEESSKPVAVKMDKTVEKRHFFRPELLIIPPLRKKLGNKARPFSIVAIVVFLLIAGGVAYWHNSNRTVPVADIIKGSFKLDVVRFQLVSTSPALNATNVNTASPIVLNFNQPVTPSKLINNMFITPTVTGVYKQGSSPDQVVFTPTTAFPQGTKFGVMINGTYQSKSGSQLGSPYEYGFTTSIPSDGIVFQDQSGLIDNVKSLASGQKESFNVLIGSDVSAGASITLYKGNSNDLLSSLVYSKTTMDGFSSENYSDLSVSTSDLQHISTQPDIKNNAIYNVAEPDGLYVAVATDATGKQLGLVWIDFSNFGVLVRQDDQKVVLDAQLFTNQQDVTANTTFYNLENGVNPLGQVTVNGLTTQNFPFNPSLDFAVSTVGNEVAVIPINELDSGGDIRVDQDLSTAQQVYTVTDKSTYQVGQTIRYAGYVRNDNDAQYTDSGQGTVKLYVAQYKGGPAFTTVNAVVNADGTISGSITPEASWLTSGDKFNQFQIFAAAVDGNSTNDIPLTSFSLTTEQNAATNINVSFSQNSYLANQSVTATITATNSNGQPVANTALDLHIFSQDYYENDAFANLADFGDTGNELPSSPVTVQLNAHGQATYTLNTALLPNDGKSQLVNLQANLVGQTGVGAAGGDSVVVHQGDGYLSFGTDRQDIPSGDDLTSEIYAYNLDGSVIANSRINYTLNDATNSSSITSGSGMTNSNGELSIDIPNSKFSNDKNSIELDASTVDGEGNTIKTATYYSNAGPLDDTYDSSGAQLLDLNVSGAPTQLSVGQQVNLTVLAKTALRTMVTMDRGRIYNPTMMQLNAGNNNFSFTVTPNLAPSFTLTFSYFLDGAYHSEGVAFNVSDPAQMATVSLSPVSSDVNAGQPTTVHINTTDNTSAPLTTSLIVDVVSSNGYDLSASASPDIFDTLFDSRPIMTSSTSSLSPVGSGGGRCGGGGGDLSSFANAIGTPLFWQPDLETNASGQASVTFTPPKGSWTINVYAMSADSQVGSATTTMTAH